MRKFFNFLILTLFVIVATGVTIRAQNALSPLGAASRQVVPANSASTAPNAARSQAVVGSLSSLPQADTLIYVNPRRILSEVVPKLLPAKDVEGMHKAFEDIKKNAGVDPNNVDYIVVAIRSKKPTADLNFQPPEFLVVASGDFSAESILTLARMASQGKLRDEKYGSKTLGLMTIDPIAKEAEKNPFLKSLSEVGIVTLNANTIAAGTPAYLKAAVDAGDGKERISAETLNSLVRDTNALISIAGTPWHSFAKSFGMLGTEANARAARCESKIGDFYGALTMDATNFMVRGAMNADNPDTAKIMSNLFSGLLRHATSSIKEASAQSTLKSLAITAEGDEVLLSGEISQQMVIDLIQKQMKPKETQATSAQATTKPPVKKRRVRRRAKP